MELSQFDYNLPRGLIAQRPSKERDSSRLLVVNSSVVHDIFSSLPSYLDEGDVLVLNDSRVLNAKLVGKKKTGGRVELLILKNSEDYSTCLIRGKKIRSGSEIKIQDVTCRVTKSFKNGVFEVMFDEKIEEIIKRFGEVPLPYYIKMPLDDSQRYQTTYASQPGSIAAPTAGLHFTQDLLKKIAERGIKLAYVTLHIGPSTFLPIHQNGGRRVSEAEFFSINEENAKIINHGIQNNSLIAVGTTAVKTLESAATQGGVSPGEGWSDIFITPGYEFKVPLKGMITNFHLPRSSLLLLVSAIFGWERVLDSYTAAISEGYRFYSLGDAMFMR
jgi:S-adenosylmethionine:tRNA ribosyltransferase-isomerase